MDEKDVELFRNMFTPEDMPTDEKELPEYIKNYAEVLKRLEKSLTEKGEK